MRFIAFIKHDKYIVNIINIYKLKYLVSVNSNIYNVTCTSFHDNYCVFLINHKVHKIIYNSMGTLSKQISISIDGIDKDISLNKDIIFQITQNISQSDNITKNKIFNIYSPMPGVISKVCKTTNDIVDQKQPLILVEAMKMENEIRSQHRGKIKKIFIKKNQTIKKNTLLMSIIC